MQSSHAPQRAGGKLNFTMMKVAASLALLAGSAAAFTPAQITKASTALKAFEKEIGATNLSGTTVCWDPLNFVVDGDQARFERLREVEIKHGRVAMLATVGFATTWNTDFRFPGCESFPGGHQAVFDIPIADLALPILGICGLLEVTWKKKAGSFPGDFGGTVFPVGFGPFATTEADMIDLRTKELLNGRAAQMGILGMMVHEQLNGKPFIFFDQFEPYFPGPVAI